MTDKKKTSEEEQLTGRLKALAAKWRVKLKDPVMRKMVKDGRLVISPLVRHLLKALPDSPPLNGKS